MGNSSTAENSALTCSNPDVYVAGMVTDAKSTSAVIWKNGVLSKLSGTEGAYSRAAEIVLSGGDVYVAGTEQVSTNQWAGKVWKNGVFTQLKHDGTNAYVTKIALSCP